MKGFVILFCLTALWTAGNAQSKEVTPNNSDLNSYYEELLNAHHGDWKALKGSGFKPYTRLKKFYEDRVQSDGQLDLKNRVQLLKESYQAVSHQKSGMPAADWKSIGPDRLDTYAGRVVAHAFDPVDPNKLWVGSASGGLWLTENKGGSWKPMTDQIPSSGVGAIAVHPEDGNVLVIGTGEGFRSVGIVFKPGVGIFRSEDSGQTWQETNISFSLQADISFLDMVWHPTDHTIIWAAGTNGLYKSSDQGRTWTITLGDGTNHGNWIIDDIIIQKDDPTQMYIAVENRGIYKSTDSGESFTQIGSRSGLPSNSLNFINITQCEAAPNVLYTSMIKTPNFDLRGVFKSEDYGETWTKLEAAPNAPCSPQLPVCQGWYNNFVAVSPFDPNHVFFGGVTMWMSRDGGLTWEQKDRLICPTCGVPPDCTMWADHHDFAFSPHDSTLMYTLSDGGIARSDDGGNCFQDMNQNLANAQIVASSVARTDPNIVIGGLFDHGLHAADLSQSTNWFKWGWFDGADVEIHSTDPTIYYGTWIDGTFWKYTKGSIEPWANQRNIGMDLSENASQFWAPIAIHPNDGNMLLTSTQQRVYRSTNGAITWKPVFAANSVTVLRFSEADPNFVYAAAWNNSTWTFHRSEDAGETWKTTQTAPGWRVTDLKTSAQDPLTVFASRNSINPNTPHIYKSTDGGETWVGIDGNLPDITTNTIEVDHRNHDVIFAGTDLGVYVTEDGGTTWTPYNEGMPITYVYDLNYSPADTTLIAATLGRGAWKTDLKSSISTSVTRLKQPVLDLQVSPNPSNGQFVLSFNLDTATPIHAVLIDVLGQPVQQLFETKMNVGAHQLAFDLDKLSFASGLYYVVLNDGRRKYAVALVLN